MTDILIAGAVGAALGALVQAIYNRTRMDERIGRAFKDGIKVGLALKGLHERRGGEE